MKDFNKNAFPQLAFGLTFSLLTIQEKKKKSKLSKKQIILSSNIPIAPKNYQNISQGYLTIHAGNMYSGIRNFSTSS
ncbi:hypothetical protein ATE84_1060 [Aquimarina sp. MAR_2010_214]|uniref:hypothetical protein n=1 Tax=Aquimarina sp. MAR_2010_214 TaxID=1250026 RepID=UPI000C706779|nr:hypothetical protein [Aquimarina sp. MAR_2010_214]PKV49044.1 hypothetical protein ATE84_1060 [Aquimarina sp. MAR_2010_214]